MSRSISAKQGCARVERVCEAVVEDSAGHGPGRASEIAVLGRRLAEVPVDANTLRRRVLDEIRRIVPFDWYVWLLTDPETAVGAAPLAAIPPSLVPRLPQLIRLKYVTEVNRWTHLPSPAASLADATGRQLARSLVWREMLVHEGVHDVASVVFVDRYGCWGFLDLWRTTTTEQFSSDDVAFLQSIAPVVTGALRLCQAATFGSVGGEPTPIGGPSVVLLSDDLVMLGQTADAHDHLRTLVPPPEGQRAIPAGAYNVAAQLRAVDSGVDANPPWARVHLSAGVWMTLRAAHVEQRRVAGGADIAVTIERASPDERAGVFARALGLSGREREVLRHLLVGRDTSQIAQAMFISEHTVQDHVKSMFAKTSVRSRRTLLARAVGT